MDRVCWGYARARRMVMMRILIALGNRIISQAIKEALGSASGTCHIDALCVLNKPKQQDSLDSYEVIVTDYLTMAKIPKDCFEHSRVLIMDNGLDQATSVSLFLTEKIAGIISADAEIDTLVKAIRVVHDGEVWINNYTIKSLLNQGITRNIKNAAKLTERETAIIRLVKEGYRNKEIAHLLSISEQTVKAHLNRIFRKTHVSARTELIAHFAMAAEERIV